MRNLKRVLSLALAAVMLMGMMVMGTSAANVSDFTDADQITNVEAATITSAINIFSGYGDGTFRPGNIVTRAEMAVIICKMLYGANVNGANFGGVNIFSDVTKDWQIGYVNLCNSLNIVNGYGNGTFQPDKTVNTAEAALMICKALGYFKTDAEYGTNWELAAITKATQLGLFGKLTLSATEGLTRDSVSVMVFNALAYAVPVDYNATFNAYYMRGASVFTGVPTGADVADVYTSTLGYKNFDLVGQVGHDEYGRPGQQWGFGEIRVANNGDILQTVVREDITFTANAPLLTYTSEQRANAVANTLRNYSFNDTALTIDGVAQADGSITGTAGIAGQTANGVIVEVYNGTKTNEAREITEVVVIRPQVATVTAVNARNNTVTLSLNRGNASGNGSESCTVGKSSRFWPVVSGVQTGDILLGVYNTDENTLLDLWVPETATGVITAIRWVASGAGANNQVGELDGNSSNRYTASSRWIRDAEHQFDNNTQINNTATLYLDRNNYVMYVAPATVAAVSNYLYVTNVWQVKEIVRGIPTPTNYARGVNTDGEIITLKIANNVFKDGDRVAENTNPTANSVVDGDNFPGVQYSYAQAAGSAFVFDNRAYSSSTNSTTESQSGRGSDGKYTNIAASSSATASGAWSGYTDPIIGTYTTDGSSVTSPTPAPVITGVGFIAEYQQGAEDTDLYLLKVPTVGSDKSAGVMVGQDDTLQSYERVINKVYMATDVTFISVNYTNANNADRLSASASEGVKFIPDDTLYIPVVTQDSAGHRLITAVYVVNGTGYATDLYYVSGIASYRVSYTDAAGRPAVGYNNGLYLAGEELDNVAVTAPVSAANIGFYRLTGMDGTGYILAKYTEDNQVVNGLIADAYNRSILVNGVWYDVSDAIWADLTDEHIDSVDSIRASMDEGVKLYASFTYDSTSERKIPCLYLTDTLNADGKVISYTDPAAASSVTGLDEVGPVLVAEDTVIALYGNVKKGIPAALATGGGNPVFAGAELGSPKQDLTTVAVSLPGTALGSSAAIRITSSANNPNNWNSGYPWASDTSINQQTGVKHAMSKTTHSGYIDPYTLAILAFADDVIKVEVMLNCGDDFVWGTNDVNFTPDYTITIDTTGVNLIP